MLKFFGSLSGNADRSRHAMFQRALLIAAITIFASAHAFALYQLEKGLSAKSPTQVSRAASGD
jgi:hypothetical protein